MKVVINKDTATRLTYLPEHLRKWEFCFAVLTLLQLVVLLQIKCTQFVHIFVGGLFILKYVNSMTSIIVISTKWINSSKRALLVMILTIVFSFLSSSSGHNFTLRLTEFELNCFLINRKKPTIAFIDLTSHPLSV